MGEIPSRSNMITTLITFPQPGDAINEFEDFTITLQTNNLAAGAFTNPEVTYYTSPQALDGGGDVIGHCHVTVQEIGDLRSTTPPNPENFAFFTGVNDVGDGQGGLSASVPGGLPAGVYRVCTMVSAANHQPVLMPVAQRGAQDDCVRFEIGGGGNNNNNNNNNGGNRNKGGNRNGGGRGKGRFRGGA